MRELSSGTRRPLINCCSPFPETSLNPCAANLSLSRYASTLSVGSTPFLQVGFGCRAFRVVKGWSSLLSCPQSCLSHFDLHEASVTDFIMSSRNATLDCTLNQIKRLECPRLRIDGFKLLPRLHVEQLTPAEHPDTSGCAAGPSL